VTPPEGPFAEVVLNVPVDRTFFYSAGGVEGAEAGKRAEVPFRSRKMTAFIVAMHGTLPELDFPAENIRPVARVIDEKPVFTPRETALARWVADYYLSSIGEALSAMIPSGRRDSGLSGFPLESGETEFDKKPLSAEQEAAVNAICGGGGGLHYLYGVTGSGKTEVFLRAAEAVLAQGKGVLYLVPEISLTYQTVKAVTGRFGGLAAVLHSGLTPSQRIRQWRRILQGDARIVVGARSAVFAPLPDLALVIIDEEHDSSYKSASAPRYHARQVALHRAQEGGVPLVMGSATPSVEAWRLMETGVLKTHRLRERIAGGKPPEIHTVNMTGTGSAALSPPLRREIESTLGEHRQVILFLNRRGFTHIFRCNTCGFELTCKNCSVPLTFHKGENRLRCHYCGWVREAPKVCPECSSLDVGYCGFGTEYIEEEVRAAFPHARIGRLDADSVRENGGLEKTLNAFRKGDFDILLGTQMVAKGLNFPGLKLVGVVLADTGLAMPDFRSAERCFSLLTQVAGRAGRFFPDGKVIVQGYNPGRHGILQACEGRIDDFYAQELEERKALGFPPFSRLLRLVFRSASEERADRASREAALFLRDALRDGNCQALGPAECPLSRIAANYRFQTLLRGQTLAPLRRAAKTYLQTRKPLPGVYVEIDVDPVNLL
jgi:primosomal protein N' (replication factor Y)